MDKGKVELLSLQHTFKEVQIAAVSVQQQSKESLEQKNNEGNEGNAAGFGDHTQATQG